MRTYHVFILVIVLQEAGRVPVKLLYPRSLHSPAAVSADVIKWHMAETSGSRNMRVKKFGTGSAHCVHTCHARRCQASAAWFASILQADVLLPSFSSKTDGFWSVMHCWQFNKLFQSHKSTVHCWQSRKIAPGSTDGTSVHGARWRPRTCEVVSVPICFEAVACLALTAAKLSAYTYCRFDRALQEVGRVLVSLFDFRNLHSSAHVMLQANKK
jgi:hypothetical protein